MTGAFWTHPLIWTFERRVMPELLGPDCFGCLVGRICYGDRVTFYDVEAPAAGLFSIRVRRGMFTVADGYGVTHGLFGQLLDAVAFGWERIDRQAARNVGIDAWLNGDGLCPWYSGD